MSINNPVFGFLNKGFILTRASEIGVNDVADAARVVEHIYDVRPEKFVLDEYKPTWKDFLKDWLPPALIRCARSSFAKFLS